MTPTPHLTFGTLRRPYGHERLARTVLLRPAECADDAVVVARPARWRDRLGARLRSAALDAQLAAGARPGASALLSLRAQALGQSRSRAMFAEQILRVLNRAQGARRTSVGQVPLRRAAVLGAAAELEELANLLLARGPLAARGLAQVRLLLTDGSSPLYFGGTTEGLRAAAIRAVEALEPSFSW